MLSNIKNTKQILTPKVTFFKSVVRRCTLKTKEFIEELQLWFRDLIQRAGSDRIENSAKVRKGPSLD